MTQATKSKRVIDYIDEYITSVLNDVKLSLIKSNYTDDMFKNYTGSGLTQTQPGLIKNKDQIIKYINIFENMKTSWKYSLEYIMATPEYN